MLEKEVKTAIVGIYIIMLISALSPTLPIQQSDYYSLALLNNQCKIGDYMITYYEGTMAHYCLFVANHSQDIKLFRVEIDVNISNYKSEEKVFVLLPGENVTIPIEIYLPMSGNYTIQAKLYILEKGKWIFTNQEVNLTITVYAGPG